MNVNEISNNEDLKTLVINELKEFGIKCRKDKRSKVQENIFCKRIFRTPLHLLELSDVILSNGSVVQIPRFVADACNCILESVETEGIFRKAGSSIRQKEIRVALEAGLPLGKTHHVIDIANVIKLFFRELPDPLIPQPIQEALLRSMFIGRNNAKGILLSCLLLPPLTINTLSFFMQFLFTVALNSFTNKMSAENLAIIFTPTVMPFSDITSHRFMNHVKLVKLLIENANLIGTVPDNIASKLLNNKATIQSTLSKSFDALDITHKKKKNRRSTQMLNGLKKIVGSALGSTENLDDTIDSKKVPSNASAANESQQPNSTTKKRKFAEPVCAFSTKKKRDLFVLRPRNSGGFLSNTPFTKEQIKSFVSLGRHNKNVSLNPAVTAMERRWSFVGSSWPKQKSKPCEILDTVAQDIECTLTAAGSSLNAKMKSTLCNSSKKEVNLFDNEYSSQIQYETIRDRLAAIETCITQKFVSILDLPKLQSENNLNGTNCVQNKYKRTLVETEALCSPATDQWAQRLTRNLKIPHSIDQQVLRSPSALKIGSIRRSSRDNTRLCRNQTWHISSIANASRPLQEGATDSANSSDFYARSNLKRGRPNTLQTGLALQQFSSDAEKSNEINLSNVKSESEQWTSGEVFFNKISQTKKDIIPANKINTLKQCSENVANASVKRLYQSLLMPVPSAVAYKRASLNTPNSMQTNTVSEQTTITRTTSEDATGRASIARLRTQNAGMVMAKAKLFDGFGGNAEGDILHSPNRVRNMSKLQRRISCHEANSPALLAGSLETPNIASIINKDNFEETPKTMLVSSLIAHHKKYNCKSPTCMEKQRTCTKMLDVINDQYLTNKDNINNKEFFRKVNTAQQSVKLTLSPKIQKVQNKTNVNSSSRSTKSLRQIHTPIKTDHRSSPRIIKLKMRKKN